MPWRQIARIVDALTFTTRLSVSSHTFCAQPRRTCEGRGTRNSRWWPGRRNRQHSGINGQHTKPEADSTSWNVQKLDPQLFEIVAILNAAGILDQDSSTEPVKLDALTTGR